MLSRNVPSPGRAVSKHVERRTEAPRPMMQAVLGVHGGSGCTMLACLFALDAVAAGEQVLLVPHPGDHDRVRTIVCSSGFPTWDAVSNTHRLGQF